MRTVRSLTPDQLRAVEATDRVCLVLAPAGSGKTEVLTRRIIRLLDESKGESFRVLTVTYTRKAAEELQQRVRAGAGSELWRVEANTIHAFAFDWLRRFGQPVGISRDVVVYSEKADRLLVLRDYFAGLGVSVDELLISGVLERIDALERERSGDEYIAEVGLSLGEIREAYFQTLEGLGGIDFGAMLTKFSDLLELDPSVLAKFRRSFRHVFVDEGQDLTEPQSLLLKKLAGQTLNLFVVADDRQSINRWAGGGIEWARTLVGADHVELSLMHNFRCAEDILAVAHRVAENFAKPAPKASAVEGAPRGQVRVCAAADEASEAVAVANWVSDLLTNGLPTGSTVEGESTGVAAEEIGIVARARFRLDGVRAALVSRGVPISMLTDTRDALISAEGRLFHALLSLTVNPMDRPAHRRALEELNGLFAGAQIIDDVDTSEKFIQQIRERATSTGIQWLVDAVVAIESVDDLEEALSVLPHKVPDPAFGEDIETVSAWWKSYRAATRQQDRSIVEFLRFIFQVQQTRPADPGVRLLTTHRSKGLEFRAVAVVGLTQGGFPDYRSLDSDSSLDEERRAFYVAVTRSSRVLLLTWPRSTLSRYGTKFVSEPSQFLTEAELH